MLPLVGASVLVGHALAYRLTGADLGPTHDYLGHAPQVLALLVLVGLLGLAVDQRAERLATAPFAGLAVVVFVAQEHLERIAGTGDVPFLLADKTFLVGVLLQLPVGLLAVWIARRLAAVIGAARPARRMPPRPWIIPLFLAPVAPRPSRRPLVGPAFGRGPPDLPRP
jgi:hypothetical protein